LSPVHDGDDVGALLIKEIKNQKGKTSHHRLVDRTPVDRVLERIVCDAPEQRFQLVQEFLPQPFAGPS
jgi:hypothetical protein